VQNLVAYQDGEEIFFLTISPIQKDEELTVWYCREFASRLGYPATGTVHSHSGSCTLLLRIQNLMGRLRILGRSVAEPGSGAFFAPWIRDPGWVEKSGYGSGMKNPDHISKCLEIIFWVKIL
jgi:hypothetical protein